MAGTMFWGRRLAAMAALAVLATGGCVGDDAGASSATPGACAPTSCEVAGKSCGEIPDGCGGTLACGTCAAPETCGAVTANVCGRGGPKIASLKFVVRHAEGRTDRDVAQGTGAVDVEITGTDLDDWTKIAITSPHGPDPSVGLSFSPPNTTPTRLLGSFVVGHGARPDTSWTLEIETPRGATSFPDAFKVTPIHVATTGVDTGDGTPGLPLRTFKLAAQKAAAGDVIALRDGIYDAAGGEAWPAITSTAFGAFEGPANVPAGVLVRGQSTAGTKLVGPGREAAGGDARFGLVFADGGEAQTLTLEGFSVGVLATTSTVKLTNVSVRDSGVVGVYARGDATLVTDGLHAATSKQAGIGLYQAAKLDAKGGLIEKNDLWGVYSNTSGTITMAATDIDANDFASIPANDVGGLLADGMGTKSLGAITLTDVRVRDNKRNGIDVRNQLTPTVVVMLRCLFQRNAVYAIGLGNVHLKARQTIIELPVNGSGECVEQGLFLGGSTGSIDFGTATEAGDNQFVLAATGTCFGIRDFRPTGAGPITMRATSFTNTAAPIAPAAGCSDATNDRKWFLNAPGTCPATGNIVLSF